MLTKNLSPYGALPEQSKQAILALSIIIERVSTLPREDRDDLFELVEGWRDAESDEDRQDIQRAMEEILAQTPIDVTVRPLVTEPEPAMPRTLKERALRVGRKIHQLREAANLNQTELAEKAGLTQSHISRLENAEHSPTYFTLEKIAKALGVSVSEIDPEVD